jgi:hypothetical protein
VKFLVDLDEHVLGAILGSGHASQSPIGHLQNHLVVAFDQLPESVRVASDAGRDELLIALGRHERVGWAHDLVTNILSTCPTQIKGGPDTPPKCRIPAASFASSPRFSYAMDRPGLINVAGGSRPAPRLRAVRIALLAQALGLLLVVGLTVPGYLAAVYLGPLALALLVTAWLWRRPRRWPAVLPLVIDAAVVGFVLLNLVAFARTGGLEPTGFVQMLLALVPAVVSLTLVIALLRRWDSRKPTPGAVSMIGSP